MQLGNINEHYKAIKAAFLEMYNRGDDFQGAIRQFTSNTERVKIRISMMLDKLNEILI